MHNDNVAKIDSKKISQETLQNYISRVLDEDGLTTYDVEENTKGVIKQSYVVKLKNGDIKNPSPEKLKALALGMRRPEEEVFSVVRGTGHDKSDLPRKIFDYATELPKNRQQDLFDIARMFFQKESAQTNGATTSEQPESQPSNTIKSRDGLPKSVIERRMQEQAKTGDKNKSKGRKAG